MNAIRKLASSWWISGGAGDYWSSLTGDRSTLRALQAGRAVAAVMVVFHHMILPTNNLVEPLPNWLSSIMSHGYLGVDFFFVLSGFILYWINNGPAKDGLWSKHYIRSRLTRVYIPYLPVAVALGLIYTLWPDVGQSGQIWSWWTTITLVPLGAQSALGIAWTLSYELTFYALAYLFFRSGAPIRWSLVWAASIILGWIVGLRFEHPVDLSMLSLLLNPINLEFVFGMLAARLVQTASPRVTIIIAAVIMTTAGAAFSFLGMERALSPIFGLAVAGLVALLVQLERAGLLRVTAGWVLLGNASYALYLIHLPLMSVVARAVGQSGPFASWPVNIAASTAFVIAVAVAYHICFERPVLRYSRQFAARRSERRQKAAEIRNEG